MRNYEWPDVFRKVYERAVEDYRAGKQTAASLFDEEAKAFLASIGCSPQELFDLVEDYVRVGEPSYEMALLVTAVRREYFIVVQNG
ncbi:MAG: hypothetical protein ACK4UN_14695, partial [Limisphaerales bacterium]